MVEPLHRSCHIALITDAWYPVWGGGQVHVWEVAKRLVDDYRCSVDIVVPNIVDVKKNSSPYDQYKNDRLRILKIGPAFLFPHFFGRLLFLLAHLSILISRQYDVYHSHSYSTSVFLPLVKLIRPRAKIAFTLHGRGKNLLGSGILGKVILFVRLADFVLFHYPYDVLFSAAAASLDQKVVAQKVIVIGNGVDVARFDRVKVKKSLRILKILWVGRFDPVKGLTFLMESVVSVKNRFPKVRFVLVGGGPQKREIERQVDKLGIGKWVEFKGSIYGDNLIKEYKSSDLFVLSSLSEGLPVTLLEAMAARLPIVATNVGDCKVLLQKARCGLICAPGDENALANSIIRIIGRGKKGQSKMGAGGYQLVKQTYNWNKIAEEYFRFYSSGFR